MRFLLSLSVPQLTSASTICSIRDFTGLTTASPMHFQRARAGGIATRADERRESKMKTIRTLTLEILGRSVSYPLSTAGSTVAFRSHGQLTAPSQQTETFELRLFNVINGDTEVDRNPITSS
jgi:hypothetical protein